MTNRPPTVQLFVHSKRTEWGRALPTRSEDDHQMFVFEDGQERKFGRSHLHLLSSVELPPAEHTKVLQALMAARPVTPTAAAAKKKRVAKKPAAAKKARPPAEEREREESVETE